MARPKVQPYSEPKSFIDIGKSNVREMAFFNDSYDTNITINSAFLYLNVYVNECVASTFSLRFEVASFLISEPFMGSLYSYVFLYMRSAHSVGRWVSICVSLFHSSKLYTLKMVFTSWPLFRLSLVHTHSPNTLAEFISNFMWILCFINVRLCVSWTVHDKWFGHR